MSATARFPFSAVVGQDEARLALLLAAVDPGIGGVLLRGDKGAAKSTLARGLAGMLPGGAPFVELPLGATEDRVVGTLDTRTPAADGSAPFRPGLLASAHGGVLYVDDVNLLPDPVVDVLLDVAASGVNRVERDGVSHSHPARFVLVGSMNPEEGELRPQLLDRFGLSVEVKAPTDPVERAEVVRRRLTHDAGGDVVGAEGDIVLRARLAAAMPADLPDTVVDFACRLAVSVGAEGLRADLVLCRAAAAYAGWEGHSVASAADVERVAPLALAHRRRRRPFDPPTISDDELQRALDSARRSFAAAYPKPEPPAPDAAAATPNGSAAGDDRGPSDLPPGPGGHDWRSIAQVLQEPMPGAPARPSDVTDGPDAPAGDAGGAGPAGFGAGAGPDAAGGADRDDAGATPSAGWSATDRWGARDAGAGDAPTAGSEARDEGGSPSGVDAGGPAGAGAPAVAGTGPFDEPPAGATARDRWETGETGETGQAGDAGATAADDTRRRWRPDDTGASPADAGAGDVRDAGAGDTAATGQPVDTGETDAGRSDDGGGPGEPGPSDAAVGFGATDDAGAPGDAAASDPAGDPDAIAGAGEAAGTAETGDPARDGDAGDTIGSADTAETADPGETGQTDEPGDDDADGSDGDDDDRPGRHAAGADRWGAGDREGSEGVTAASDVPPGSSPWGSLSGTTFGAPPPGATPAGPAPASAPLPPIPPPPTAPPAGHEPGPAATPPPVPPPPGETGGDVPEPPGSESDLGWSTPPDGGGRSEPVTDVGPHEPLAGAGAPGGVALAEPIAPAPVTVPEGPVPPPSPVTSSPTAVGVLGRTRPRPVGRTVVLAVDAGGSTGTYQRVEATTGAVMGLLSDAYLRRDRVALVTFRGASAEVALPPTASLELARSRLAELPTGGVTPLADGIEAALSLARQAVDNGFPPLVVLVSDGRATGAQNAQERATAAAAAVAEAGVEVVVVDPTTGATPSARAEQLAAQLGGRCVRLEALSPRALETAVRAALR